MPTIETIRRINERRQERDKNRLPNIIAGLSETGIVREPAVKALEGYLHLLTTAQKLTLHITDELIQTLLPI